jgi:hemolysin activation/secretion protein
LNILKIRLFSYGLLALSGSALAQLPPSAGSQMLQIPPARAQQKAAPKLETEPRRAPVIPETDSVRITVKSLHVTGASAYSEAELFALTGFATGSELTLSDLRGMASKIADYYHRNGYFLAQVYLPPQDIKDGTVTIAVIEGRYGQITLRNQTTLSDDLASDLLAGLNSGVPVAAAPIESRLLLLSDLPGVNVKSTLVPGVSVGVSDLIVEVMPGQRVTGNVDADNAGNRYTGEHRVGASISLNNPRGNGDVATLRALTAGSGLIYARASYQMQFGKAKAGLAYSAMEYKLGREFASLQAQGSAAISSIYGSYPLIRSRNHNLYAGLAFDAKSFHDNMDSISTVTDKKARVLMASLYGDHRDSLGGGGLNGYSLTWSVGKLDIDTPAARSLDAATTQTNGHYSKLGFSASRLQRVTEVISLYAAINGQFAAKNLDVSEKMEMGGMVAVRAYPEGEAYADEGYVLNLEARMQMPQFSEKMPGLMQLIGFVDSGNVATHKNPWETGPNRRKLSGAGIGINWSDTNNFIATAYYAHKLGSEAATSAPDKSDRFWIQVVKYF